MRRLFIVGAKLLGLFGIWSAIFVILQIISFGQMLQFGSMHYGENWIFVVSIILYVLGSIGCFILSIWFSTILLLRTEWLADKVGLDKDNELSGWLEEKKLLNLGILLLGFYVLISAVPGFVKSSLTLLGTFLLTNPPGLRDVPTRLIHYAIPVFINFLELAIGVLLILMPVRIIGWVEKLQKKLESKLVKTEELNEKGDD
jgi:hypothetical protein